MPRYTSADMMKLKKAETRPPSSAPTAKLPAGPQTVKVPVGGQVTIRRASNGVIATVTDTNWRDQGMVLAADASDLKIE